jgi:hypothetical protein
VELWGNILTASEVANLYNQSRYKQFSPHGLIGATNNATPILNVNAFSGAIREYANAYAITNASVTLMRDGHLNTMRFPVVASSKLSIPGFTLPVTDITISIWIKQFTAGGSNVGTILATSLTGSGKFTIWTTSNVINVTSDNGTTKSSVANSVVYGKWMHICITRKSDGKASIYMDSVLSGAADGATGTPLASSGIWIGNTYWSSSRAINANLASVQIFSGILTAGEISQIYSSEKSKYL